MKLSKTGHLALSLLAGTAGAYAADPSQAAKPKAYLVADAHLDTQWNWDVQTTIKDYVWNTINQNLKLLEMYPNYVFNFEGAVKYAWMKEYYPREYAMLQKHIDSGRWHICGSSWDATDAIVPSVESAIRNIMLGQDFYRKEFGAEGTDIFLPDCFGFGWTLPTIASHCGLIGFSSQKLGWRHGNFHPHGRYPYNVGIWKGIDGSEIMMTHGYAYEHRWDHEDLTESKLLKDHLAENDLGMVYNYYGTGDMGGSPTITSVDAVERAVNKKEGEIEVISATSDQLFKDFMPYSSHPELPKYDGELLMDIHGTGCYTSQAAMKLYNRQNELLGDAAERAAVAAEMLGVENYPGEALTEGWRRFIWHQFHDDLTGTSIPRAYEFSWNDELLTLKQFAGILGHSVNAVASQLDTRVKGTPVVFYNALGSEATDVVELQIPVKGKPGNVAAYDPEGKPVAAQLLGISDGKANVLVEATVPANGYAVYDIRLSGSSKGKATTTSNTVDTVENSVYKLTFDNNGDIISLFDKKANKELVEKGKAIRLAIFTKNESFEWPAWEVMKETIDGEPQSINEDVRISVVENGPLRTTLCVEKKHGDSKFRQYIRLYEGALADRIDFYNDVDWATTNALVKAEFPLTVSNPKATYDLGLGTIERGNNTDIAYEVYSQRWADLTDSGKDYGVTVMNDCKYGWDKPSDNVIRLTLLHTPGTKQRYEYQNRQDFGHHTFTYSLCGHNGDLDKSEANSRADVLNQRIKAFSADKHAGKLGKSYSAAAINNNDLAIKAFKKAENGDEYVVRVYDVSGKGADGRIEFALPVVAAVEADGTEKTIGAASFSGNMLNVKVAPNGLRTYKVKFAPVESVNKSEFAQVPLNYDKKCFSWNAFAGDADFSAGYAYAAELVPDKIVSDGVPFKLENKELFNGKVCKGDKITIPAGKYNRLYILAAAATEEKPAEGVLRAGKRSTVLKVPSYTGFIGQWGHKGHTEGYLSDADVAFVGTHRHNSQGDQPYEFTYMFKYAVDIPANAKEIILPDNPDLVIFAATLASGENKEGEVLSKLYRTSIDSKQTSMQICENKNILKKEYLTGWSGFVNEKESPAMMLDGDNTTKWCDVKRIPSYVTFDLQKPQTISGWTLVSAGNEDQSYVTTSCLLQARNDESEEWKTIDTMLGNNRNVVKRKLEKPVDTRYLRLLVVQPEQTAKGLDTRIYEFAVY